MVASQGRGIVRVLALFPMNMSRLSFIAASAALLCAASSAALAQQAYPATLTGHAVLPAVITDRVRPGNCFAPFHWNDVFGDNLAINAVTHDAVDPISLQPEFKFCAVALQRVELIDHQFLQTPAPATVDSSPLPEELAMSSIETFADLAGIRCLPSPPLNDSERTYLAGFLSGLQSPAGRQAAGVPVCTMPAPLTLPALTPVN